MFQLSPRKGSFFSRVQVELSISLSMTTIDVHEFDLDASKSNHFPTIEEPLLYHLEPEEYFLQKVPDECV